jgi:hypothetical protein
MDVGRNPKFVVDAGSADTRGELRAWDATRAELDGWRTGPAMGPARRAVKRGTRRLEVRPGDGKPSVQAVGEQYCLGGSRNLSDAAKPQRNLRNGDSKPRIFQCWRAPCYGNAWRSTTVGPADGNDTVSE